MATARVTGGQGYAPGYGQVVGIKPKKKTAWAGGMGSSIQSGVNRALSPFTPSAPGGAGAGSTAGAPARGSVAGGLPPDATYEQQLGVYGKQRDDTVAGLEGQKTATLADYGYNATYGGDGSVTGLSVDPNNPYSRAAQLQRSYDGAKRGTTTSMASRGLLYSSAIQNAQNSNDTNYSTSKDSLEKNLGQVLASIIGSQRTARSDYDLNAAGAFGERVGRAGSSPLYSPTAPAGPPATQPKVDQSKWVVTQYKSPTGLPARKFADGHREVLVNGQWKRV